LLFDYKTKGKTKYTVAKHTIWYKHLSDS